MAEHAPTTAEQAETQMDVYQWMAYGLARGFVGPDVCITHDGLPTSEAEDEAEEETGEGDCIHILRLYPDAESKTAIELNHSPSEWRQLN